MRRTRLGWIALVFLESTMAATALGYRDLQDCPDLTPLEPPAVTSNSARRCARTVAAASRRYIRDAHTAHAACLRRFQEGALAGKAPAVCRGLVRLSTGAFDVPTDIETAAALTAAEARLRQAIVAGCSDAGASALASCGATASALADCVLADQRDHLLDVLDQEFGEVAPVTDLAARRCQRAVERAARSYLTRLGNAHDRCLRDHGDGASTLHRADHCLGAIRGGLDAPPLDPATASRIARAGALFRTHVLRDCTAADVAALDACGSTPAQLASCLQCVGRRETIYLLEGRRGGLADRPATSFIPWGALANPVLEDPDRQMKNQAVAYHDGWIWVVAPNTLRRTHDFLSYEAIDVPGGRWFGDLSRIGGRWYQTTNGNVGGDQFEIFARTTTDFLTWTPLASITPGLFINSTIDGALVERAGFVFLALKDRVQQLPYVTRSVSGSVDGAWIAPQRAVAGSTDLLDGFAEAYHFADIDGQLRIVATGRDPEPYRCATHPEYFTYTCSHEPFIYTLPDVTGDLGTWTTWRHKTHLRVPYEAWNPIMHANSGQLVDWRLHDGFFYLSYAGSLDGDSFELRGHGKIGLARSRDLVHWRVAGDLRD